MGNSAFLWQTSDKCEVQLPIFLQQQSLWPGRAIVLFSAVISPRVVDTFLAIGYKGLFFMLDTSIHVFQEVFLPDSQPNQN